MARKVRIALATIALIMLMISAAYVDYQNPTWKANRIAYMNMISMACSFTTMLLSNRYERQQKDRHPKQ